MSSGPAGNDAVRAVLAERQQAINAALEEDLPKGDPPSLYDAARHLIEAGGKRLRPTISLLAAEATVDVEPGSEPYRSFPALDGERFDLMKAAVSIEIIQSFTLIHDDIMDDDDVRRGVPAVHAQFDEPTAILAGDTLYSKAFEIMLDTGVPPERGIRALKLLAETCTRICEGQAMDISFEDDPDVSVAAYRRMVERKTAVLFRAAAAVPAILVGADDETVDALGEYGLTIGEGFQIHDDVLDLTVPSEQLGKTRGSDLVEGKRTLISLHAREHGVDLESIRPPADDPAAIEAAVAELEAAGSIEFARGEAASLIDRGIERLEILPENRPRSLLSGIAGYLVERGY